MLEDFKKGGICQVAESNNPFSEEVFVVHDKDIEFLEILERMDTKTPFMIVIMGIPGVGKTQLLQTLCREKLQGQIAGDYLWKAVRSRYKFLHLDSQRASSENVVWTVPTIDIYFSTRAADKGLKRLVHEIASKVVKNDSIVLAGNVGVLRKERQAANEIWKQLSRISGIEVRRLSIPEGGVWVKEYGGNPISDKSEKLFREFSVAFLRFLKRRFDAYYSQKSATCQTADLCREVRSSIKVLIELFGEAAFPKRLHDLLCAIRLKHRDVYLTPRTLLTFWAHVIDNLRLQTAKGKRLDETEKSIFSSILKSSLPSNYMPSVYEIRETGVGTARSNEIDGLLREEELYTEDDRLAARGQYYFRYKSNSDAMRIIYDGVYSSFISDSRSKEVMNEAFKHFFLYSDKGFQKSKMDLERWRIYTFNIKGKSKGRSVYFTNKEAVERFIGLVPLEVGPIDFETSRSRASTLKLKYEAGPTLPSLSVDLDVFQCFLDLYRGFHVDLSSYPHTLAKIESVLSQLDEICFQFLVDFFSKEMGEDLIMQKNVKIIDGVIA